MRTATIERKTKETSISVSLDLDGTGLYDVSTGIGFLDHMLEQLSRHSLMDLDRQRRPVTCTSIFTTPPKIPVSPSAKRSAKALGDRKGITRYGSALIPMDETLSRSRWMCRTVRI